MRTNRPLALILALALGWGPRAASAQIISSPTPSLTISPAPIVTNTSRTTTQFDKTSDITLADVPGLLNNVAASTTYAFLAGVPYACVTTGGVKWAMGGTATATSIRYTGGNLDATLGGVSTATALGTVVAASTGNSGGFLILVGVITVNAAGTLTIQFAQNASSATPSSVLTGAYFLIWQVP